MEYELFNSDKKLLYIEFPAYIKLYLYIVQAYITPRHLPNQPIYAYPALMCNFDVYLRLVTYFQKLRYYRFIFGCESKNSPLPVSSRFNI